MKKNLELLLALVMLFSCMLGIMPVADEAAGGGSSAGSYKPTIAYSNVNYTEDLTLMFAVPAPAADALAEGSAVKVVIWEAPSVIYSYKEAVTTSDNAASAVALEAEEAKVTIGDREHLVFKYKGLTPEKMTDVIYARAVVVDKDGKATAYGDVIDYSIVEYVHTAKGGFSADNTPVIADTKVIDLLDSMLDFGAIVQELADDGKGYFPNGYYANDELRKIWVTPVVAGKTLDKVFGGFFKYEEDSYATVREPFYNGYEVVAYKDAEGNDIVDAYPGEYDEAAGLQIDAVDADIEVTLVYDLITLREVSASEFGEGFAVNNIEQGVTKGDATILAELGTKWSGYTVDLKIGSTSANFGMVGAAFVESSGRKNYYAGFKNIEDQSNPDNLLALLSVTDQTTFGITNYISPAELTLMGYGDTVDDAITIEVEIGKPSPDAKVNSLSMVLRNRSSWATSDGHNTAQTYFNLFNIQNNNVVIHGDSTKICTLPDTGLVKVAITITAAGEFKAYYSNEDGEMVLACVRNAEILASTEYKDKHAKYLANLEDNDPTNDETYAIYKDIASYLSQNTFQPIWTLGSNLKTNAAFEAASVMLNGVDTPIVKDGTVNYAALQAYAEQNYSVLFNEWNIYLGDVYDDGTTLVSVYGEDFGEGFAFNNLTGNIGNYAGDPAKLAAMGATYDDPTKVSLNAYRFEKLFRRVWFNGNIGGTQLFQGFKTVADPKNSKNLVLQVTTADRTTLDLETIKPEALLSSGWGADGAITIEFEIGKPNPDADVTTRVFQLHRRTDENPNAGLGGNSQANIFKITNNKIYLSTEGDAIDSSKLIGEIPDTGFVKVAFVISGNGVVKAYFSDANGAMTYVCEKDISGYSTFAGEDFASWMSYVITPRWYIGEDTDPAVVQAATVDIDGVPTPVYADGAYNEAALQVYMETYHSFLLDSFRIVGKALYE